MTWQPVDCHAHSTFSDGRLTVAQVVDRARSLGVRPSISDHISRDAYRGLRQRRRGARLSRRARADHGAARRRILLARRPLARSAADDVVRRFTHRLGSMHAIRMPNGSLVACLLARRCPTDSICRSTWTLTPRASSSSRREMPVDVFAHPTLIALPFRELDIDTLWTEERETRHRRRVVRRRHRIRDLESLLAARALRETCRRPRRSHLARLRRPHVRPGREIARPLALARNSACRTSDLYDPMRHGSRTMHARSIDDSLPRALGRSDLVAADRRRHRRRRRTSDRLRRPGERRAPRATIEDLGDVVLHAGARQRAHATSSSPRCAASSRISIFADGFFGSRSRAERCSIATRCSTRRDTESKRALRAGITSYADTCESGVVIAGDARSWACAA